MSTYNESIKLVLAAVNKFLTVTLKSEKLSKPAEREKSKVTEQLQKLFADYDSLAPQTGDEGSVSSNKDQSCDEVHNTTGSSHGSEEDGYSQNIPATTVKALTDPLKIGYLDKKKKDIIGFYSWQKQYCIIHRGIMYCFKKPGDKKQQDSFFLTGYTVQNAPQYFKDDAKKKCSFELIFPGKRTYQFCADTKEDFESWRDAINAVNNKPVAEGEDVYEEFAETEVRAASTVETNLPGSVDMKKTCGVENEEMDVDAENPQSKQNDPVNGVNQDIEIEDSYNDGDIYEHVESMPSNFTYNASEEKKIMEKVKSIPLPPLPTSPIASDDSESLKPPPLPIRNMPLPPPPSIPPPAIPPVDKLRTPTLGTLNHPSEDFENMYYGMWDCKGSSLNELDFERGQVIHILNRDLEAESWWVGELAGDIGLVPKNYLHPAYQLVDAGGP